MKRFFDLAFCIIFGPIILVVCLILSIILILSQGFPILFQQNRAGLNGRSFKIIKFRTMLANTSNKNTQFDAGNNSRVTFVGKYLRACKLDEFPQIWNVFIGEMSMVGPRPEVEYWTKKFPEKWAKIHTVKPGITDPGSIKFRHEEKILQNAEDPEEEYLNRILPEKLKIYEDYVDNCNIYNDFKIIVKTIYVLFR